jgi:hypothetical protein
VVLPLVAAKAVTRKQLRASLRGVKRRSNPVRRRDRIASLARNDETRVPRWFASVGAVYKLTREWQLNATVRQDWQIATQPTFTYNATSVLLGVRVQR